MIANKQKRNKWSWVGSSVISCSDKISIRKRSPGAQISGVNQTFEMSVRTNNPSAMLRSQVRASYSKQSSPQTARHGDLQQRERNL